MDAQGQDVREWSGAQGQDVREWSDARAHRDKM